MGIRKATKKDIIVIAEIMLNEFSKSPYKEKVKIEEVINSLNFYFKIGQILVSVENKEINGAIVFKIEKWWEGQVIIIEDLTAKEKRINQILITHIESYAKKIKAKSINFSTHKKTPAIKKYIENGYSVDKNTIFMKKEL